MTAVSDVELADRISRRRARLLILCGILFIAGQAVYFSEGQDLARASVVKLGIWIIWVFTLLAVLATGGGVLLKRSVRRLMNDEVTRANRQRALASGFWVATASSITLYGIAMFEPVAAREAIHVILTSAIAGALISFGTLERRLHGND